MSAFRKNHMGASILFVGQDVDIGTPRVDEIHFLKIVLTSYRIERIFGKNIRCRPAGSRRWWGLILGS